METVRTAVIAVVCREHNDSVFRNIFAFVQSTENGADLNIDLGMQPIIEVEVASPGFIGRTRQLVRVVQGLLKTWFVLLQRGQVLVVDRYFPNKIVASGQKILQGID